MAKSKEGMVKTMTGEGESGSCLKLEVGSHDLALRLAKAGSTRM